MGKTIMNVAAVSLDGFIADDNDGIEPLFDWLDNGDVTWSSPGIEHEFRTTQASPTSRRPIPAMWRRRSSGGGCSI